MLRHPADHRRQAVEPLDGPPVAAESGHRRGPVAGDVAPIDHLAVRLPIVGDHPIAEELGPACHDAAAGEKIDERAAGLHRRLLHGLMDQPSSLRLLPMYGMSWLKRNSEVRAAA